VPDRESQLASGPGKLPGAIERSRFLVLIGCLVGMLVILPVMPLRFHQTIGVDVALIAVLLSCIWSMGHRRTVIVTGFLLLVPAFLASWFAYEDGRPLALAGLSCSLAFLAVTALAMLVSIVRQKDVATDTVLAGICVYLLFAVMWAVVYELIERVQPGSFGPLSATRGGTTGRLVSPEFIYYSVFTLSTIGPQDLRPLSGMAAAWTGLEAIVGQLYLAVLIARLIGRHASRP